MSDPEEPKDHADEYVQNLQRTVSDLRKLGISKTPEFAGHLLSINGMVAYHQTLAVHVQQCIELGDKANAEVEMLRAANQRLARSLRQVRSQLQSVARPAPANPPQPIVNPKSDKL